MGNRATKQGGQVIARTKATTGKGTRVNAKVAQSQRRHVVLEATSRVQSKAPVNVTKGLRD